MYEGSVDNVAITNIYIFHCQPPINPTPVRTMGYCGFVLYLGSCGRCKVVQGTTDEGYYDTRWLAGLWFTQAKVEGIMLKAAWHTGRHCSVVNDPLGKPGRTPLYVSLPSTWGSVDGHQMFSPFFVGGFLTGDADRYKSLDLEMKLLSP
jgi:hypothetical protein